ncbi:N-acetylmuramate alpha-1-phosphate uridylyltransferase MurU [Piscinibacter sakaiensis]|uniref:N-acetylmuramate alpha-1-phosphate uridylyltransferase MurU n=1 Tax=Piscinibacter sakaiensis TaxID=1547922 RepID=UPI003AAC7940
MKPPKAMLLAAGRGERMRPLTDTTPKPLLKIGGRPMIEWHLDALARAGIREVVINTAWLEQQFAAALGDGARWNLRIRYSMEGRDHGGALETAGGIATALRWLVDDADDPFWVASADIHAPEFVFDAAAVQMMRDDPQRLAHLWLVENPPFHPAGDFGIDAGGRGLADDAGPDGRRWTYSNFGLLRAALLDGIEAGSRAALGPLLKAGMRQRRISAEVYRGRWHNVGTPEQLAELNR